MMIPMDGSPLQVTTWTTRFFHLHPTAGALLALTLVAFVGLALGTIRIRGIGLGVAGILFSGIIFGHFGITPTHDVLEFARDAGLILFVYTIGLQVGPSFIASMQRRGITLNILALSIVIFGAATSIGIAIYAGLDASTIAGIFCGATTNTPSLGAAQDALKSVPGLSAVALARPALGYAATYPFGILGIILSMLVLRTIFYKGASRVTEDSGSGPLIRKNILIENLLFDGLAIESLSAVTKADIIISRIKKSGLNEVQAAHISTILNREDVVLAVGSRREVEAFCKEAGRSADVDLLELPGRLQFRSVTVTRKRVLGKTLSELALEEKYGVTVTRLNRANLELVANANKRLHFGDQLHIVGEDSQLNAAAKELGNSVKALQATDLLPNLLGIALGICLGSLPIPLPGLPGPLILGNAGGPLLVAIVLSIIGCLGPFHWYLPNTVNIALRELGIAIFLASVGLMAGSKFLDTILNGDGAYWILYGATITIVPLLIVGAISALALKLTFGPTYGLLAGSMTDPPALAFANNIVKDDSPSEVYASVYPLAMTLRILLAQIIVLLLSR